MELRTMVQNRMAGEDLFLHNREGIRIPTAQIKQEYQAIRNYLLNQIRSSELIAIKATKDYRYLLTILAAFEAGITYIPMMVDYPQDRVSQIQADSQFKLLIDDASLEKIVTSPLLEAPLSLPELSPDQTAYIIFTSGSTGKPKGVMIPRRAITNFFKNIEQEFSFLSSVDHLLQLSEFSFDLSFNDIALFLMHNVQVHFSNFQHDLFKFALEMEKYEISVLSTVPHNLSMLLSDVLFERVNVSRLKTLLICGARFSYGLYQNCKTKLGTNINLYNQYGPTESTVFSHQKKMSFNETHDCSNSNVSIGTTLNQVNSIVVKDGVRLAAFQEGELLLGGEQLLSRYINDEEKTASVLLNLEGKTYYKTGDIAFYDEKNEYYIVGRLDDTIKVRGFRINLLDVDSYIQRLSYVADVATIAIPHETAENQTIGFMKLKEAKSVKEIKKDLLEFMVDYQIPEKIIMVESFPTNVNGKIDKKMLKQNYLNSLKK
jgi:acyl-CoA synthetase (AMP-forming)/AMP-acid ligase II